MLLFLSSVQHFCQWSLSYFFIETTEWLGVPRQTQGGPGDGDLRRKPAGATRLLGVVCRHRLSGQAAWSPRVADFEVKMTDEFNFTVLVRTQSVSCDGVHLFAISATCLVAVRDV